MRLCDKRSYTSKYRTFVGSLCSEDNLEQAYSKKARLAMCAGRGFDIVMWLPLKILSYRKLKLVNEDLLEGIEIILFVEDKHGLLVVNGIYRAEAQRAITVGYQNGITGDACRTFVAIREWLDIRQKHKRQKCFLEDVFLAVYQVASITHGFTNLEFIIQRMVVGAGDTHTTMTNTSIYREFLSEHQPL